MSPSVGVVIPGKDEKDEHATIHSTVAASRSVRAQQPPVQRGVVAGTGSADGGLEVAPAVPADYVGTLTAMSSPHGRVRLAAEAGSVTR